MNVLLYYPRLIAALVFRPSPRCHATLQHWVNAQIFWRWHQPWTNPLDTFGMSVVRLYALATKSSFAAWHRKARLSSIAFRYFFLCLLFVWPFVAAIIAFRGRGHRLARWNTLVNQLRIYFSESWSHDTDVVDPLDCTDFLAPLLYIFGRTGRRIPDRKDETVDYCRRLGIPTPRVLAAVDRRTPGKTYVVKPIDGCRAVGIHFTDEPELFLGLPDTIVQEVARNPLSLRRLWGTKALACLRFITAIKDDGNYEVVTCILRVPIDDSLFDNTCKGNGYAAVDSCGVLQQLFTDANPATGYTHHPKTGERVEGASIDGYAECAALAVQVHRSLAAGMPVLNSDIASTDDGPKLIEINRAPGQYEQMYRNEYSEKCVRAICRTISLVDRDVRAWLQLSNNFVKDNFSRDSRRCRAPSLPSDADQLGENSASIVHRGAEEIAEASV